MYEGSAFQRGKTDSSPNTTRPEDIGGACQCLSVPVSACQCQNYRCQTLVATAKAKNLA
jgi:hypothetical protein